MAIVVTTMIITTSVHDQPREGLGVMIRIREQRGCFACVRTMLVCLPSLPSHMCKSPITVIDPAHHSYTTSFMASPRRHMMGKGSRVSSPLRGKLPSFFGFQTINSMILQMILYDFSETVTPGDFRNVARLACYQYYY